MQMNGGWVIEVDIRKYFDCVDHGKLGEIVRERIRDGEILRLIGKWLNAGVLEEGRKTLPEAGTPQGGVISPMLANIYLHKVLDLWFEKEVQPRLQGQAFLVRYADDAVLSFASERDAKRVMEILPKRFEKYGLKLHPDKTRLLEFKPPFSGKRRETFDFLGWTHYWGKTRKGQWMMKHKTMRARLSRALKRMNQWMKLVRHREIEQQQEALKEKLMGHYNYYGISGNSKALKSFYYQTERLWRKWLGRRSQRAKRSWEWFAQLLRSNPLPQPRIKVRLYAT
jgi:group II intron reverse transcriptase/maturase